MTELVSKSISKTLSIFMNRSFNERIFPEAWKVANVIPFFFKKVINLQYKLSTCSTLKLPR